MRQLENSTIKLMEREDGEAVEGEKEKKKEKEEEIKTLLLIYQRLFIEHVCKYANNNNNLD